MLTQTSAPKGWRWDQGRNQYFLFDNIQRVAQAMVKLDGVSLALRDGDQLRAPLEAETSLEFLPRHYKVWRNYGRVFGSCLLAAKVANELQVTDVCRGIARTDDNRLDMDSYLSVIMPKFSYPFPAFDDYNLTSPQVFPFCACLKLLLSKQVIGANISIDEVAGKVIGNNLTGTEEVGAYRDLRDSQYRSDEVERRQVREMLKFLSQSSFLKWQNNVLFLDVLPGDTESFGALEYLATPQMGPRSADAGLEVLRLGSQPQQDYERVISVTRKQPADIVFTEGSRVRMTHLRSERSPYLRTALFDSMRGHYVCDVCKRDPRVMYPWTSNILEVHHLLPLSSAIYVNGGSTSLDDVAPVCPNCHRSIHIYYKNYLNHNQKSDFADKKESLHVYRTAKAEVVV